MRLVLTDKEHDEDYTSRISALTKSDKKEVARQSADAFCIYSRLDHAFHECEAFDVAFLSNYAMLGHEDLWKQANIVHTEMFNLYQQIASRFYDMEEAKDEE